jgi:hypothetical protein
MKNTIKRRKSRLRHRGGSIGSDCYPGVRRIGLLPNRQHNYAGGLIWEGANGVRISIVKEKIDAPRMAQRGCRTTVGYLAPRDMRILVRQTIRRYGHSSNI